MKSPTFLALALLLAASAASAQGTRIWRCGNTYTNNQSEAQAQGCKPVEGGNVTIVEGTRIANNAPVRVAAAAGAVSAGAAPAMREAQRVDSAEQRARDSDARQILETELRKAEVRKAELLKEYNNGEPEKLGPETRNHQKYLDRVSDLKSSLGRVDNDIAGIQRELQRLGGAQPAASR